MTNFPEASDNTTNLPDVAGWDQSGHNIATGEYDENRIHSKFLDVVRTAIMAIEMKLGAAASTPLANRVLRGNAAGITEWVAESVIPVTNWGRGTGTAGQALVVKNDETGLEFSDQFATDASLEAHINDPDDAHDASAISSIPAGTLAATNVQDALYELDTEKETPAGAQSKVDAAIAALIDTSPTTLDTLNELAAALGDDPNFATTVTNQVAAVQASLDAHEVDTINVHGIADTAALETQAGAQSKADGAEATAAAALADHADNLGAGAHVNQQAAIADLALVVTDPPTQAEVQAIADKVDAILAALRAGGQLAI